MLVSLKKAISLLTPSERKRGIVVLFVAIGMALIDALSVASIMPFLSLLGNPGLLSEGGGGVMMSLYKLSQKYGVVGPTDFLIILGLATLALICISAVCRSFTLYFISSYIEMRRCSISLRLFEGYLRQPYVFFLSRHSSEMSKVLLSGVDQVISNIFIPAFNMAANIFVFGAITTLLIIVNPWLALSAAGFLGGCYLVVFFITKKQLTNLGTRLDKSNKERFLAISEAFGGIKDVKIHGVESAALLGYEKPSREFAAVQAKQQILTHIPKYAIEAFAFGGIIAIVNLLIVSVGVDDGGYLGKILPIVGLYAFSAYRLQPALQAIFHGAAGLRYGQTVVDSLYESWLSVGAHSPISENDALPLSSIDKVEFINVSYSYPNSERFSLAKVNFKISAGSITGIVGSTGAGKSTLVDLFLGLLRPTEGVITVGASEITDDNLRDWQRNVGYVPQEIFLGNGTIAENIAFGIPAAEIDHEQVIRCAKIAQVHDLIIEEFPDQYKSLVGERGVRLSGGQRQRIGIARALYRNPEVLVFDEATSALDSLTEHSVMQAIEALANKKTIIIIAHRLGTIKNCDRIILLDHGVVIGDGKYQELIESNQKFASMVELNKLS